LLSLVLFSLVIGGWLTVWQLMLCTFLMGTGQAFYMTARQVYVYDIVGSTGAINGIALISLAQRFGEIIGALITGWLIAWQGPGMAFLVMSVTYGAGALVLYGLRQVGAAAPDFKEPLLENLRSYFRALRENRVMLSLIISTSAAEVLGFSHQVVLPILAKEVLNVGAVGLGILTAFRSVGGALGVVLVAALDVVRRRGMFLLVVLVLFGLGQVLLAHSPSFWVAVVFVTFISVMASITDILHHTLLQLSVSNEQRGRAMGSWIVGTGLAPLGQLEVGYLAEATNARVALLVNGVTLAALALVMGLLLPRLRRL
ncbi:MAG: MFS transporter, partial [Dehalococcoidia bacterium]